MLDECFVELAPKPFDNRTKEVGHEPFYSFDFQSPKRDSIDSIPTKHASESPPGSPKSPVTSPVAVKLTHTHINIARLACHNANTDGPPQPLPSARALRTPSYTGPSPEEATSRPNACATDFSSAKSGWTASYPTASNDFDFWYQDSSGGHRGSGNLFTDYLRWNALRVAEEEMMHKVSVPMNEEKEEQSGCGGLFSDVRDRLLRHA
eukprot:GDKH01003637.1.p1 GENE.GDKH01003637.1~~GDKH01003637.1.p1  ORF type:complete len:207 (-),score=18.96 GDKH01003637.1:386-1006(-)